MSLLRRRMMLSKQSELPVTNPELVYTPNTALNHTLPPPYEYNLNGIGTTEFLPVYQGQVIVYFNPTTSINISNVTIIVYNSNKSNADYWALRIGSERNFTAKAGIGNGFFRMCIVMDGEADSYCYNQTTGQVYYAGINTPYYGKQNIND